MDKLNGFAVEVAYVSKPEKGYTAKMREVIKEDPDANEWTFEFDKAGYSGWISDYRYLCFYLKSLFKQIRMSSCPYKYNKFWKAFCIVWGTW